MQTQKVVITGVKKFKGEIDGKSFDSCTVFMMFPFSANDESALGSCTQAVRYGKSDNFKQFEGRPFPLNVEADFQPVSTGKEIRQELQAVRLAPAVSKVA